MCDCDHKMTSESPTRALSFSTQQSSPVASSIMEGHRVGISTILANQTSSSSSSQRNSSPTTTPSKNSQVSSTPVQHNPTSSQEFCLRWNNYQSNLTCVFDQLLQNESFVDVTLACDGHSIKAHKMVLSACSPYFQTLFFDNPCQHPIIIMRDVKWPELKAIVEFMYKGEINVSQDQIGPLLRVAEMLKIRGLADVNQDQDIDTPSSAADNHTRPIVPEITTKPKSASPQTTTINNANTNNNNNNNPPSSRSVTSPSTQSLSTTQTAKKSSTVSARNWADLENVESPHSQHHLAMMNARLSSSNSAGSVNISNASRDLLMANINEMDLASGQFHRGNSRDGGPPQRKRKWHLTDERGIDSPMSVGGGAGRETPDHNLDSPSPLQSHPLSSSSTPIPNPSIIKPPTTPTPLSNYPLPPSSLESMGLSALGGHPDDLEIKPGIAEMIREEERVSEILHLRLFI